MCEFESRTGAVFDRFGSHFPISSSSMVVWQLEASDLARLPARSGNSQRARGSNPQYPAWESKLTLLRFQCLQNRSRTINVHALHTVHAVPDLRIAGGRFWGRFIMRCCWRSQI